MLERCRECEGDGREWSVLRARQRNLSKASGHRREEVTGAEKVQRGRISGLEISVRLEEAKAIYKAVIKS